MVLGSIVNWMFDSLKFRCLVKPPTLYLCSLAKRHPCNETNTLADLDNTTRPLALNVHII